MGKRKEIGVRRLKNEASSIVEEVRERRSEYVVTRRGKPVAVLRPIKGTEDLSEHAERVRAALNKLRKTAREIGALAPDQSATAAVSRQRR